MAEIKKEGAIDIRRTIQSLFQNIWFILGFRKSYRVEVILSTIAFAVFMTMVFLFPNRPDLYALTSPLFIGPTVFQVLKYRRMVKLLPKTEKRFVQQPTIPLYTIILSAIASAFSIYSLPIALFNTLFVEDISVFLEKVDIVKVKRGARIVFEPMRRFELVVISGGTFATALVSYVITGNPFVFIYPIISYGMVVYSLIYVPPDVRSEVEERKKTFIEELVKRIPYLYLLFRVIYMKPEMIRLAREAGFTGASFYDFVRKSAGVFVFGTYVTLAVTPLAYAFLEPIGMGMYVLLLPLLSSLVLLYVPQMYLKMKRNSRAGKISRNMLLILSYFSSTFSVSESFTNAMEYIAFTPQLSKMFGMDQESKIYVNLYRVVGDETKAMEEYADTIPDEMYRDAVRSIRDIADNEGYGAVFRSLVTRLLDYTSRYIDKTSQMFESIGGNMISVIILFQTALPVILFLTNPLMMPVMMIMGGVMSAFIIAAIAQAVLPDVPSDFIHTKPRLRYAALLFSIVAAALTMVEYVFLNNYLTLIIPLNIGAGLAVAVWYTYKEDFDLNNMYLNKFPDLLVLFSSSMSRTNAVERSLYELSGQATFPEKMRNSFRKLASVFALLNVERISYRGPYWYKYFIFLAGIAARYGTTPRELYKAISEFMLEFKKFFAHVRMFSKSLIMLTLMSMVVMTIEIQIVTDFMISLQRAGMAGMLEQAGVASPIPMLSEEEILLMKNIGYVGLLTIALLNGLAISKVASGSFRDSKYCFLMFVIELVLIIVSEYTGFGLRLVTSVP